MWKKEISLEQLNQFATTGLAQCLNIQISQLNADSLCASMPVNECTRQPFGLLHGGASAALAETVASIGAYLMLEDDQQAVGLELNINHLRAQREGIVCACAKPLHVGRRTQVWDIDIRNQDNKRVAVARLTVSVIQAESH